MLVMLRDHPLRHSYRSFCPICSGRYDMQDLLAIESSWLTELAPHMYRLVPVNPALRG